MVTPKTSKKKSVNVAPSTQTRKVTGQPRKSPPPQPRGFKDSGLDIRSPEPSLKRKGAIF